MFSWPMRTPARRTAVTFPRLNRPIFRGPTRNPIASARKIAISGYVWSVLTSQSMSASLSAAHA